MAGWDLADGLMGIGPRSCSGFLEYWRADGVVGGACGMRAWLLCLSRISFEVD